jgi:hypothetical protein
MTAAKMAGYFSATAKIFAHAVLMNLFIGLSR